jgi:hypothetical protein
MLQKEKYPEIVYGWGFCDMRDQFGNNTSSAFF